MAEGERRLLKPMRSRVLWWQSLVAWVGKDLLIFRLCLTVKRERAFTLHSHSIVPGGFDVTSYTTLFTPLTSLMMRVAVAPRNAMSKG
jgi:hypothetical protein